MLPNEAFGNMSMDASQLPTTAIKTCKKTQKLMYVLYILTFLPTATISVIQFELPQGICHKDTICRKVQPKFLFQLAPLRAHRIQYQL